ncbi:exodeoxyribonuclease VII large subunit [Pueribacillus sp. YX66]|uniref:exodeoxyribonuclease VII large subunit n=1 Tax=Pueribacillus sp. YX66 TaxID=3229242 RepID=UPI00358CE561
MEQEQYLTITALTRYIKRQFDRDTLLNNVWVRGEISNFKLHSRGHMYFTLKDENARIQSVMFAGNNRSLQFRPEDGMKVLVRGDVTVYEPYGQYQLYAREMQPDGIGALFLAFEKLKQKLEEEGLFATEVKKPLPRYPREIGVITSRTGAAVRDIFTTIKRRYPIAKITLFPVDVQGEFAAPSIAKAIQMANMLNKHDVLIVGRGGGSIEDLWPFNEEAVARSIFSSTIPIISAVGHETDFTIADFVADVRAATPTAAAELAVPQLTEIHEKVFERQGRLIRAVMNRLQFEKKRLTHLQHSYAFRYPLQLIRQKNQDLDRLLERLRREMNVQVERKVEKWKNIDQQIRHKHPKRLLIEAKEQRMQITKRLIREMKQRHKESMMDFQQNISKLSALSPLNVMERGYSFITKEGQVVNSIKNVQLSDMIKVNLKDGQLDCHVWGMEESKNE